MDRRSSISIPRSIQLAKSLAKPLFKRLRFRARRALAPPLLVFVLSSVAQAQGTMDFSGAQTLMGTFKTTLLYIHLSGRDLSAKLAASMTQIHARRIQMLAEMNV